MKNIPVFPCYYAYMLRVWQERPAAPEQEAVWRFSLEEVASHRQQAFASLESLVAYLRGQTERADHSQQAGGPGEAEHSQET